ncbi:MAG TPA: hypothetical protein VLA82_04510 [Actinomycetota bacterium]|nr:hypothetical protein [Actinomycetota bacterium]
MNVNEAAIETLGRQALSGWRGTVVDRLVGRPLERRTRFTAAQIRAAVGLVFFVYMGYRLAVALVRSIREAQPA